jgi:signal transduction histidine kinase
MEFKEMAFANVTHDLRTPLNAIIYTIDKIKEIFNL